MSRVFVTVLALTAAALGGGLGLLLLFPSYTSTVTIRNTGTDAVELDVTMYHPGPFEWRGSLDPGSKIVRRATFSDNSFVVNCRDQGGGQSHSGGYVTSGAAFEVAINVESCSDVVISPQMR